MEMQLLFENVQLHENHLIEKPVKPDEVAIATLDVFDRKC